MISSMLDEAMLTVTTKQSEMQSLLAINLVSVLEPMKV